MSARKLASSALAPSVSLHAKTTRLDLPASAVRIRKNGVEFMSHNPIDVWTEMTVALETPAHPDTKLHCTGVVVACDGNRHQGYRVSLLFTGMSRQAEARLQALAFSKLA